MNKEKQFKKRFNKLTGKYAIICSEDDTIPMPEKGSDQLEAIWEWIEDHDKKQKKDIIKMIEGERVDERSASEGNCVVKGRFVGVSNRAGNCWRDAEIFNQALQTIKEKI